MPKKDKRHSSFAYGAVGLGGIGLAEGSLDQATGQTRLYHGTSQRIHDKVMKEGLQPSFGGSGSATAANSERFIKNSKGYVHVTGHKPIANMFARIMADKDAGRPFSKNGDPGALRSPGEGRRVHMHVNYDKYERMAPDTDCGATESTKRFAAKSKEAINTDEIVGSTAGVGQRLKRSLTYFPKYVKANPSRFVTGAAVTAAGVGIAGYAAKGIYDNFNTKTSAYKVAFLDQLAHIGPDLLTHLGHAASYVGTAASHVGSQIASHVTPEAVSGAAHHLGLGTLAHVGSNAAIKAFRSTKNNRVTQSLGELGIKHGLEGKQVHPFLMDRIKQLVGPEAVAEYGGSRNLTTGGLSKIKETIGATNPNRTIAASAVKAAYPPARAAADTIAKKHLNISSKADFNSYPVLGGVAKSSDSFFNSGGLTQHKGIGGKIINKATALLDKSSVPLGHKSVLTNTKVRHVADAGFAAASMTVPGLGDHVAINSLREIATKMPFGGNAVKGRVMQGMNPDKAVPLFGKFGPKVVEGKGVLGKARRIGGDLLYSPTAWGEARDFGVQAHKDGFTEKTIGKVTPLIGGFL